jgi:hypothetical protein
MKPSLEWVNEDGVRCMRLPDVEDVFFDVNDLAKLCLGFDPAEVPEGWRRDALLRFQAAASIVQPAVQHRLAVALLEELGSTLPEDFKTLRPKLVKPSGKPSPEEIAKSQGEEKPKSPLEGGSSDD